MFLILPLILISGLMSILAIVMFASVYGLGLIILSSMIRNVRQETSRDSLRIFLRVVAVDHLLSAATGLACGAFMAGSPEMRSLVPLLDATGNPDESLTIALGTAAAFFAVLWTLTAALLWGISADLDPRASIYRQLRWHPWTLVMLWVGAGLNLGTLGLSLVIAAPLIWHLNHVARLSRQSSLVWTLAIAVRQQLPLGPEVLSLANGLWGRQRLRLQLLSENLDAGASLATSLERQPGLVPLSVVMMIRTGEETNMLAAALESCAVNYARRTERECDIMTAQQAFLLLLVPMLVIPQIVGFLCYYIVPKFKKIFEDFGTELPALTRAVTNLMDPGSGIFFLIFLFSLGGLILIVVLNIRDWEKDWPLLNWVIPRINGPPVLRALALLIREKRPLGAGVQGLMWSHPRKSVRRRLEYLYQSLNQGGDLAHSLATEKFIRRGDIPLLRAAERVQNLPWCLEQIAESVEAKFWYRFRVFLEVGYPVAVVSVGIMVLMVTAAFFLPLVKLLNDLS